MGMFDKLKKQINEVTENVKNQAKDLPDALKDVNVADSIKGLAKKSGEAFDSFKNESSEFIKNTAASLNRKELVPTELLDTDSALQIIYLLMAVDNEIANEEEEKFSAIGKDMDPSFEEHREDIIIKCKETLSKVIDESDLYDTVHDRIGDIVREAFASSEGSIQPDLLLWNLLAIAHSEEQYSNLERRLIRFFARQTNIDKSVLDIMENTIETLIALEKEEAWLKTTSKPYLEIEKNLNEIADRRMAIMQSVQALMLD